MNSKSIILLMTICLVGSGCSRLEKTDLLAASNTTEETTKIEGLKTEGLVSETIGSDPMPEAVTREIVEPKEEAIDEGLTKDAAKAYLEVVNQLILSYGEGEISQTSFDGASIMKGTAIIRLIDFDGDGNKELYCAYADDPEFWVNKQVLYGYSMEQGLIPIMKPCPVSNPGTDVSPVTMFLYKQDNVYLMESQEGKFMRYQTVRDHVLVTELEYEDGWNSDRITVDGKTVTMEELTNIVDEMEAGGTKKAIDYFYRVNDNELAKTRQTRKYIEMLAGEAESDILNMMFINTGWPEKKTDLKQVKLFLDTENIQYTEKVNQSHERIDLVLEDGSSMLFLSARDSQDKANDVRLIMVGDVFDEDGFCEVFKNDMDTGGDQEYGPDTSTQLLDHASLVDFNQTELSIYRNQIYARHGRKFDDPFLKSVFFLKTWYLPSYDAAAFAEKEDQLLSEIEKENIKRIVETEMARGYR